MSNMVIQRVNLNSTERIEVEKFLKEFELLLDRDIEYTVAARIDEKIIGTCSFSGKVLKCFAVKEDIQGEGIASKLITHLTDELFKRGIYETFIFTKPKNKGIFEGLNYKEVHKTKGVILLEGGMANVDRYVKSMFKKSGLENEKKACLVMNCNPFTVGHRYLIEKASLENNEVVVFVVEENLSLFPFETRLSLVKKGVMDLKNVCVIPGGNYIISSNTFPSYFIKEEDERLLEYTKLDAGIFGKYIAPAFNIEKRYVGTEPYCKVTKAYNDALINILPDYGIQVSLVERTKADGIAVSASEVRKCIAQDDWDRIKRIVPITTYEYLISKEAEKVVERIKRSGNPIDR